MVQRGKPENLAGKAKISCRVGDLGWTEISSWHMQKRAGGAMPGWARLQDHPRVLEQGVGYIRLGFSTRREDQISGHILGATVAAPLWDCSAHQSIWRAESDDKPSQAGPQKST